MTDCTTEPVHFSNLGRRRVVADFAGGTITSDAGALLLREVDRKLGLIEKVAAAVPDPRDPSRVGHEQKTMLAQRVLGLALGYGDLNDHQGLREDSLMRAAAGRCVDAGRPLASPPTLCRLEQRATRRTLPEVNAAFVEAFVASFDAPPAEPVLDFDATDDPVHGGQEGRCFHGYYGGYCFLPLYVFRGSPLLAAYPRPSDIDASRRSRAVLELLAGRRRRAWPAVEVVFRAGSGFCRWRLMRWCDRHGVDYVIGLAKSKALEKQAAAFVGWAEDAHQVSQTKRRHFRELADAAGPRDRERRVVVKAERLEQGPHLRFVVTSLGGEPKHPYDGVYCQRGETESRVKEQPLGLFAGRTSCHAFPANSFRVLLSAAAYVLIEHLRRVGLAGTGLAQARVPTIRTRLLKIGGRVVATARRLVLHLAGGFPPKDLFRQVAAALTRATTPRPAAPASG